MFGAFLSALKIRKVDPSGQPPLLAPDRAPTFRDSEDHPFIAFYVPDQLTFAPPRPLVPGYVQGTGHFNADAARAEQSTWDRSCDGSAQRAFFKTYVKTGLQKI